MKTKRGPLNVDAECIALFTAMGAATTALPDSEPGPEIRRMLWQLIPFAKALGELALKHPEETLELWKKALVEPMPFGAPPIGLPEEEPEQP
jgi:hypothetical protein